MNNPSKTILFIGDSVTAAERKYGTDDLGEGYVGKIAAYINTFAADRSYQVINKGFDGHRAQNLRFNLTEFLAYQPEILTILIGVNDCWKAIDSGIEHDAAITAGFERCYREILLSVKHALPNCKIVLMEPFIIPAKQNKEDWRRTLYSKIEVIRRLSREFKTIYIPLDGLFAEACSQNPPSLYSIDSIHPIDAGHSLIAQHWIKRVL